MKENSLESALTGHASTLSIEGFVAFAKAAGFKYITQATMYDENGVECKTSIDKSKSKKWKELKQKWKKKK